MRASARASGLLVLATLGAAASASVGGLHAHTHQQLAASRVQHQHQHHHHHHRNNHNHNNQQQQQEQLVASSAATDGQELHFGAKVALTVLAGALVLVASATFVDLNSDSGGGGGDKTASDNGNYDAAAHGFHEPREQQAAARDQRSPSLSSHNSSTLFCSANSVASASVPILGRHHHADNKHFKRNLHLSLATSDDDADLSAKQGAGRTKPHGAVWRIELATSAVTAGGQQEASAQPNKQTAGRRELARQLFLAFSLRQSAKLIFQRQAQQGQPQSIDSLHGLRFLSMIWLIAMHSYSFAFRWMFFAKSPSLDDIYKTAASQLLANGTFACDSFLFAGGFLLPYLAFPARASSGEEQQQGRNNNSNSSNNNNENESNSKTELTAGPKKEWRCKQNTNESFTLARVLSNLLHRYIRMMPLMMAIIGLSATLLRYLGDGPAWDDSTIMFDKWCRKNWWINALFVHNFVNRENMCLSHSWYSAVDIQLFLVGQLILFVLFRSRKFGILLLGVGLLGAQLLTGTLTLMHHLPAVPQLQSFSEQTMNRYYGEIYIKPYCRASPYLIGILLAYLMRTTSLGRTKLNKWQVGAGWLASISLLLSILLAMQPAMNGRAPTELESALYSALSRPLWACATGWMIFACMTENGGVFATILSARLFVPLSRLTYPAFLIHPIVMAVFYGSRQSSFEFSHYLMLYLILGNIVITYASAFVLSALFELPLLTGERAIKRAFR